MVRTWYTGICLSIAATTARGGLHGPRRNAGSQNDRADCPGHLLIRKVIDGLGIQVERRLFCAFHDAYNFGSGIPRPRLNTLADRVLSREELIGKGFVDHDDRGAIRRVMLSEVSPLKKPNGHRFEIAGSDDGHVCTISLRWRSGTFLDTEGNHDLIPDHGNGPTGCRRMHTRKSSQAFE